MIEQTNRDYYFIHIQILPEKITILSQNLQQLQNLSFPFTMLVRWMRMHYIVKAARSTCAHMPRGSRKVWVEMIQVQELNQERDTSAGSHHITVGRAGGHCQQGFRHLLNICTPCSTVQFKPVYIIQYSLNKYTYIQTVQYSTVQIKQVNSTVHNSFEKYTYIHIYIHIYTYKQNTAVQYSLNKFTVQYSLDK